MKNWKLVAAISAIAILVVVISYSYFSNQTPAPMMKVYMEQLPSAWEKITILKSDEHFGIATEPMKPGEKVPNNYFPSGILIGRTVTLTCTDRSFAVIPQGPQLRTANILKPGAEAKLEQDGLYSVVLLEKKNSIWVPVFACYVLKSTDGEWRPAWNRAMLKKQGQPDPLEA